MLRLRDVARGGDGRLGPILLLLPHEPLLLLPGNAAVGWDSVLAGLGVPGRLGRPAGAPGQVGGWDSNFASLSAADPYA